MVLFLVALFGYMDVLIIGKWLMVDASEAACAPSLLIGSNSCTSTTFGLCLM